jgi:DNA polymerase-3 subunit delta'
LRIPSVEAVTKLLVERDGADPTMAKAAALAAQSHIGRARRLIRDPEARGRRENIIAIPSRSQTVGQAVITAGQLVDVANQEAKALSEQYDEIERAELARQLGVEEGATRLPPAIRAQFKQFDDDAKRRATRRQRDVLDQALIDLLSFYRDVLNLQWHSRVDLINSQQASEIAEVADVSSVEQTMARLAAIELARIRLAANVAPLLAIEAMTVALV